MVDNTWRVRCQLRSALDYSYLQQDYKETNMVDDTWRVRCQLRSALEYSYPQQDYNTKTDKKKGVKHRLKQVREFFRNLFGRCMAAEEDDDG